MTVHIELELAKEKLDLLDELARARKQDVNEILTAAIAEWLEHEAKRQRAWQTLREFAGSFSNSEPNNNFARDHDKP